MIKRCDSVTGNSSSIDAGYSEPLGPLQERPKTSRRLNESDYADVEIGDDLLPLWIAAFQWYVSMRLTRFSAWPTTDV